MQETVSDESWKARYRELLDEVEGKERAWQHVEGALRNAASRLGIAAMGRDPVLDQQLEQIVHNVREPGAESALDDALDAMARIVIEQEVGATSEPTVDLSDFVARLPLPAAQQKRYLDELAGGGAPAQRAALKALAIDITRLLAVPNDDEHALLAAARQLVARLTAAAVQSPSLAASIAPLEDALSSASDEPARALGDIADGVATLLGRIDSQKTELEEFLELVTERLSRFESFASQTQAASEARRADTDALGSGVADHMHDLRDAVAKTQDVDALKRRVADRLDSIDAQIQAFRTREERRAEEAEARNATLTEQINKLRHRTADLAARCGDQERRLMHDALTGVHTRYAYDQRLQEEFQRWQRHGQPLSYSIWDIDHFKRVNDTFGHQAGDRLLAAVANMLSERTRTEDFVARLGGEEFVIVFVGTPINAAHALAERLRGAIADAEFHHNDQTIDVTISCGITAFRSGDTPASVYERADSALYDAKQGGRNRSVKV